MNLAMILTWHEKKRRKEKHHTTLLRAYPTICLLISYKAYNNNRLGAKKIAIKN
jgi:hypothetical protein